MKQLLFPLLFLPCLALAQYPGNAGQKITLGEQTTADGLVYRGVASIDTVTATSKITRANKQDTSTYILLDTVTNLLWHYKIGSNAWIQAGGGTAVTSFSAGTTGLTPSTATTGAVTLAGTLAVANGGTNATSLTANKVMVGNGTSGVLTPTDLHWNNSTSLLGIGETNLSTFKLTVKGDFPILFNTTSTSNTLTYGGTRFFRNTSTLNNGNGFQYSFNDVGGNAAEYGYFGGYIIDNTVGSTDGGFIFAPTLNNARTEAMRILNTGNVGIGTTSPSALLNVMGTVRINSASAPDANYYLQLENSSSQKAKANAWDTYSDKRIKTDIQPIFNAIDKVNLLNPVYYQKHDSYVENDFLNIDYDNSVKSLGFIAQEVYNVVPEAVNTGTTNELWAMDYTKIIPILTKAIQEQQALIKALEQRILTLENK